jgi:hypothetical protein
MQKIIVTVIAVFCLFSVVLANFIFLEYSATPSNNSVLIEWTTKSETGINKFAIMRSSDDKSFFEIGSVVPVKDGQNYSFTDDNVVFKDTQTFFYKLRAVRADDSLVEETQSLPVHPNISGIYRTWGAIKAMFR